MSWIEKLRNKPKAEKIKILWIVVTIAVIILVAAWIVIGNVKPGAEKNTEIFRNIQDSVKNFKYDKPQLK